MARLNTIGAELNSLTADVEISATTLSGGGAVAVSTTHVRTGTYAFRSSNAGTNGAGEIDLTFASSEQNGPFYARTYLYIVAYPNATGSIFQLINAAGSTGSKIRMTSTGTLILTDGANVQIGSASGILSLNQWYRIELSHFNNTGSGKAENNALIDGVSFASSTTGTNTGGISRIFFGCTSAVSAYDLYYDDLAINDSTGSFQTGFPGAGQVSVYLRPSAAGDNNAFTVQVGGTAGSTNNFTRVNEITPDDATSYNGDITSGDIDDFNIDNTPTSIGASDTINVVQVGVRYRALVAAAEAAFVVRAKKAASGTVSESAAITPNSTTWKSNTNAQPRNPALTLYNDPDGSPWTKATLDSAQIGYRISTTNTNAADISGVWMIIDSTPNTFVPRRPLMGVGM